MKTIIVLACLVLSVFAAEKYNSKYDNFDVDTILNNDRLLNSYIQCFLDLGRCTKEGLDFKKSFPEAVQTNCGKCTDKQKSTIKSVIKTIQKKRPEDWKQLIAKNDPTGKYAAGFQKFIES